MKIIQNFSNLKHVRKIPYTDILIWLSGLNALKKLGYDLKIYCTEADIPWLKQWGLWDLYDEYDTTTIASCDVSDINETMFWSVRKLLCIDHEFQLCKQVCYLDTDIVLEKPLNLDNCDAAFWSTEHWDQNPIYCNLDYLSTPPGYSYPTYFRQQQGSYNCGLMFFRRKELWDIYFRDYMAFVRRNPAQIMVTYTSDDDSTVRNVWACNSEQRLLYAVSKHYHWKVNTVLAKPGNGGGVEGVHYYIWRALWRRANSYDFKPEERETMYQVLYEVINWLYEHLPPHQQELFKDVQYIQDALVQAPTSYL